MHGFVQVLFASDIEACKYAAHTKCVKLVPNNCSKQEVKDPNMKKSISKTKFENMNDLVAALKDPKNGIYNILAIGET